MSMLDYSYDVVSKKSAHTQRVLQQQLKSTAHFTKDILLVIQIRSNFELPSFIRLQQKLRHVTIKLLSCHLQTFVATAPLNFCWEQIEISTKWIYEFQ